MIKSLETILFNIVIYTNPLTYLFLLCYGFKDEIDYRAKQFEEYKYYKQSEEYLDYLERDFYGEGFINNEFDVDDYDYES